MAQSVERYLGKVEVTGSIPVISLNKKKDIHSDILLFIYADNVELNHSFGQVCAKHKLESELLCNSFVRLPVRWNEPVLTVDVCVSRKLENDLFASRLVDFPYACLILPPPQTTYLSLQTLSPAKPYMVYFYIAVQTIKFLFFQ